MTLKDNLASIAEQCHSDKWGDDSELLTYSETTLRHYLEDKNTFKAKA